MPAAAYYLTAAGGRTAGVGGNLGGFVVDLRPKIDEFVIAVDHSFNIISNYFIVSDYFFDVSGYLFAASDHSFNVSDYILVERNNYFVMSDNYFSVSSVSFDINGFPGKVSVQFCNVSVHSFTVRRLSGAVNERFTVYKL